MIRPIPKTSNSHAFSQRIPTIYLRGEPIDLREADSNSLMKQLTKTKEYLTRNDEEL